MSIAVAVYVGVMGLFIGSFLNVLIDRLPKGQNVLWGRSHCDFCKRNLRWYELIPLVSFVIQRGRCRRCHKRLSFQYPILELITAIGFALLYAVHFSSIVVCISYCVIFSAFLVMFFSDYKYQILPDSMIVFGIAGTLSMLLFTKSPFDIAVHVASGAGAFVFFLLLWLVTKKRGIGFGDVKLSFLLGLLLGFPYVVLALYVAFLTGAMVGVILILGRKKSMKSKIAFGPFLILGTAIVSIFYREALRLWNFIF